MVYLTAEYLAPLPEACRALGLRLVSSKNIVTTPGFPDGSFFYVKYDYKAEDCNKLLLVVDKAGQLVAAQLVDESPRSIRLRGHSNQRKLHNLIQCRWKGSPDWRIAYATSSAGNNCIVIESELLDEEGKPREYSKAFLTKPVVNLVLLTIQRMQAKPSLQASTARGQEDPPESPTPPLTVTKATRSPKELEEYLLNTKWSWLPNTSEWIIFRPKGVLEASWGGKNVNATYQVNADLTIVLTVGGRSYGKLNFNKDFTSFVLQDAGHNRYGNFQQRLDRSDAASKEQPAAVSVSRVSTDKPTKEAFPRLLAQVRAKPGKVTYALTPAVNHAVKKFPADRTMFVDRGYKIPALDFEPAQGITLSPPIFASPQAKITIKGTVVVHMYFQVNLPAESVDKVRDILIKDGWLLLEQEPYEQRWKWGGLKMVKICTDETLSFPVGGFPARVPTFIFSSPTGDPPEVTELH